MNVSDFPYARLHVSFSTVNEKMQCALSLTPVSLAYVGGGRLSLLLANPFSSIFNQCRCCACVVSTILVSAGRKRLSLRVCTSRWWWWLETSRMRVKRRSWKKLWFSSAGCMFVFRLRSDEIVKKFIRLEMVDVSRWNALLKTSLLIHKKLFLWNFWFIKNKRLKCLAREANKVKRFLESAIIFHPVLCESYRVSWRVHARWGQENELEFANCSN